MASKVPDYEIRLLKRGEIPQLIDLWKESHMKTPEVASIAALYTWYDYDPDGFYVAVTSDGIVIGSCAGILHHTDFVYLGFYFVKPTLRQQGIGRKIWNKVMERVGDRNAGCSAVPEQLENYRDRAGFPIVTNWNIIICVATEIPTHKMLTEVSEINIKVLQSDDAKEANNITQYDADVSSFARPRFISLLCKERGTVTVVATNSSDNSICGYGCIKQNVKGNALVGPLFADNSSIAEVILYHMAKAFPLAKNDGVNMVSVDCNKEVLTLFDKLGFEIKCRFPKLYRKKEIDVKFSKLYALHHINFSPI